MSFIKLAPLPEYSTKELRDLISRILEEELYAPLLKEMEFPAGALKNSEDALLDALSSGRVAFHRGYFRGRFSSALSRELRKLGARWDRKHGGFAILASKLPPNILRAVEAQASRMQRAEQKIRDRLNPELSAKIADEIEPHEFFSRALWSTDGKIAKQLEAITVKPELSSAQREQIARQYTTNLRLDIKKWTDAEIIRLRKHVERVATSGTRYESLAEFIERRKGVSKRKARFLARQETNLMLMSHQETRYVSAGSKGYIWRCVHGSPNHPVRPMHKALNGKFILWSSPPVVNIKGERKHAGCDFGCRCGRQVVIKF